MNIIWDGMLRGKFRRKSMGGVWIPKQKGGASVAGSIACGVTTFFCTLVYTPSIIISPIIVSLTIPAVGSVYISIAQFKALHMHHEWNENGRQ